MDKQNLTGKDLLLAFLYSPGKNDEVNESIIGRTRIMKMMFLFEKEVAKDFFDKNYTPSLFGFQGYLFGPYSKKIIDDLTFFQSIKMIKTSETAIPLSTISKAEDEHCNDEIDTEEYELEYYLSDLGEKYVRTKLWNNFSDSQKSILKTFKNNINSISLNKLLDYVYNKYKDYTNNSIIADKHIRG